MTSLLCFLRIAFCRGASREVLTVPLIDPIPAGKDLLDKILGTAVGNDVHDGIRRSLAVVAAALQVRAALRWRRGPGFPYCENPDGLEDLWQDGDAGCLAPLYRAAVGDGAEAPGAVWTAAAAAEDGPLQPAFRAAAQAGRQSFAVIPLTPATGTVIGVLEVVADDALTRPAVEQLVQAAPAFALLLQYRRAATGRRAAEAKFRTVVELIPAITYILSLDAGFTPMYVSPKIEPLTGFTVGDFMGRADFWRSRIHPGDAEAVSHRLTEACRRRRPFDMEYRVLDHAGETLWFHDRAQVAVDEDGRALCLQGMIFDISARRRAEAEKAGLEMEMRQVQKLEAIGTLAHGVAHEINNPIYGIMNYAQLIVDDLGVDSRLGAFAAEIITETQRVAEIVRNLLTFARQEKQSHSPAQITDIIDGTLSLMQAVMRRDQILLELDVPDDLPQLKCRSQQLQQVLMNLMTNARDALNEKYPGYDPDKIIKITAAAREARGQVRITVEDHGIGIPIAIRNQLFDPFFTTKPKDRGSGLGLSISHGIIQDHGGQLSVESDVGEFTRFHIDLPLDNGWSNHGGAAGDSTHLTQA